MKFLVAGLAFSLLLVLSIVPGANAAQLTVSYELLPFAKFDDPGYFDADTESEQKVYGLEYMFPVLRNGREHNMMAKFSGHLRDFEYRGGDLTGERVNQLYDLRFSLTDMRQVKPRWMLVTTVTPGIASDLEASLSGDDFVFMASTMMRKQVRRGLSWGLGVAYANSFGQPRIIPLFNFSWQGKGRWRVKGTLPAKMGVWYQISQKVTAGLEARLKGNQFHAAPDLFTGVDDPVIKFSAIRVGPIVQIALNQKFSFTGGVFFQPKDRFEFFDGDTELASLDRKSGAVYWVALKVAP